MRRPYQYCYDFINKFDRIKSYLYGSQTRRLGEETQIVKLPITSLECNPTQLVRRVAVHKLVLMLTIVVPSPDLQEIYPETKNLQPS